MTTRIKFANPPRLAAGQCPVCGTRKSLARFAGESFPVRVGDVTDTVDDLSGDRCSACDEVFFDAASAKRYADAGDSLVQKIRKVAGEKLRKARLALGLSQADAGILAGGGHNGFSRYENGLAEPVPAVWNLFHLLERHPQLAVDLPGVTVKLISGESGAAKKIRGGFLIRGKPARLVVESNPTVAAGRVVAAKSAQTRVGRAEPAAKAPVRKAASRRSA